MEEIREEKVSQILSWLQAAARGKMSRKTYKKLQQQKVKTHAWNSNSYLLTKTFIFCYSWHYIAFKEPSGIL